LPRRRQSPAGEPLPPPGRGLTYHRSEKSQRRNLAGRGAGSAMDQTLQIQDENRTAWTSGAKLTGGWTWLPCSPSSETVEALAADGNKRIAGWLGFRDTPEGKARHLPLPISAPSQMDLFDYKPRLADARAENPPDLIRNGSASPA